jgi:hypothetical protein
MRGFNVAALMCRGIDAHRGELTDNGKRLQCDRAHVSAESAEIVAGTASAFKCFNVAALT